MHLSALKYVLFLEFKVEMEQNLKYNEGPYFHPCSLNVDKQVLRFALQVSVKPDLDHTAIGAR